MLQRKAFSLIFADDSLEGNDCLPKAENNLAHVNQAELTPSIVAVIFGSLLACGLLGEGSRVTAIRPVRAANPWKLAGIMDLMASRS